MGVINIYKVKCDQCGKTVEMTGRGEYLSRLPVGWLNVSVAESKGMGSSSVRFEKDVCCEACMLKAMHGLKKLAPFREHERKMVAHTV